MAEVLDHMHIYINLQESNQIIKKRKQHQFVRFAGSVLAIYIYIYILPGGLGCPRDLVMLRDDQIHKAGGN